MDEQKLVKPTVFLPRRESTASDAEEIVFYKNESKEMFEKYSGFYEENLGKLWTHHMVETASDEVDYKNSPEHIKELIETIFKAFANNDIAVDNAYFAIGANTYASSIKMLFSYVLFSESIHAKSYALLTDALGFSTDFYKEFLEIPVFSDKLRKLRDLTPPPLSTYGSEDSSYYVNNMLRYCFNVSALTEGIALFSQFSILLFLGRNGKFMNMTNINLWSITDENKHVEQMSEVFRDSIRYDLPDGKLPDDLRAELIQDYVELVEAELSLTDYIFKDSEVIKIGDNCFIDKATHKDYIQYIAEYRLYQFGLGAYPTRPNPYQFIDEMLNANISTDFFSRKETNYQFTSASRPDSLADVRANLAKLKEIGKPL